MSKKLNKDKKKMAQKFRMTEGIIVLKGESNKAKIFHVFVEQFKDCDDQSVERWREIQNS